MPFRFGIDIGGTFTDFTLINDDNDTVYLHKQLTTPNDPSIALLEGIDQLLARENVDIAQVSSVIHGSTLVTNSLIERCGSPVGMLVTEGFRDTLDIALESRYDLYDLGIRLPSPLVARDLRIEVCERIQADGTIGIPLSIREVEAACEWLISQGVESIAVCFIHSFTNPVHEEIAVRRIRELFPKIYVSSSADIFPFMREYERWTTTSMNAFVQPVVDTYLRRVEDGLKERGFVGRLHIMMSSGGTVTPEVARQYPIRMLESGPAAGVLMASFHGSKLGLDRILSYDMGGTTAKGAIIRDAEPLKRYEIEVARVHEFKKGSGLPAKIPVLDMIEIGSGGGSIAEIDARGVLRVGPRSSGANPGPACYGKGGEKPTVSDANLVLGYYNPDHFLGGNMQLDKVAAESALKRFVAEALDVDVVRAAWGIHEVVNEDVARAFRVHASERGFDYRSSMMVAFGGSGPAHAARVARKLRIPKVVFPRASGVMSAFGMLVSPLAFEVARSFRAVHSDLTADVFKTLLTELSESASTFLIQAGTAMADIRVQYRLDMRHLGQGHEIEVELPAHKPLDQVLVELPEYFARSYARHFGQSHLKQPIEILNWKVEAKGPAPDIEALKFATVSDRANALKGVRQAYFLESGGFIDCPVYDRYALNAADEITGPAIIEEAECTVVIGPGDVASIDFNGNLVAAIDAAKSNSGQADADGPSASQRSFK